MKTLQLAIPTICITILSYVGILISRDVDKLKQRVTELEQLELQKEIQELKWRYELVNDIKSK